MPTIRRICLVTLLATAAAVALAGPASAKGPTSGTIEGEGLEQPIAIAGDEGGPTDFWMLAEQTGFFPLTFGGVPDPTLDAAPTTDLGPKLVVTWHVPGGPAPTDVSAIVEDLYPWAAGGPLAYVAPGQPFFQTEHTHGGWLRAEPSVPATLERLGVPSRETIEAAMAAAHRPPPSASHFPITALVAGLVVLAAVGVAAGRIRRNRARVAPA